LCVHIIQRYDDTMEGRRERGGRGNRGIYIYVIYSGPLLSAGVVSLRQHALLYVLVHFIHAHIRGRPHTYSSAFPHEGTHTFVRAHPRENAHAHAHDAHGRARTDTHAPWHACPDHARTHAPAHELAYMRTHTRKHTRTRTHARAPALRTARKHMHACIRRMHIHVYVRARANTPTHAHALVQTHANIFLAAR